MLGVHSAAADRPTVCAVIPVYDHPQTIGTVVTAVRAHGLPVILVDDGSRAECARALDALAATDAAVRVLRRATNGGKGAAVMDGMRAAFEAGYSHAFQIDADGQHDISAIPAAMERMRAAPTHLIMGVPRFDASMPKSRLYGRWLTHVLVWLETVSTRIRDSMCGFRIYPLAAVMAVAARHKLGSRMDFDIDIAVRLVWAGLRIDTVDVGVHYPADGISHFHLWDDNRRITLMHLRLVGGMLRRLPSLLIQRLVMRNRP